MSAFRSRIVVDGTPAGEQLDHGGGVAAVAISTLPDDTPVIITGNPRGPHAAGARRLADGYTGSSPATSSRSAP